MPWWGPSDQGTKVPSTWNLEPSRYHVAGDGGLLPAALGFFPLPPTFLFAVILTMTAACACTASSACKHEPTSSSKFLSACAHLSEQVVVLVTPHKGATHYRPCHGIRTNRGKMILNRLPIILADGDREGGHRPAIPNQKGTAGPVSQSEYHGQAEPARAC